MAEKQQDRVSYSFGMKLSLPTKYESADFHISMSSDVEVGFAETLETTLERVKKEVHNAANKIYAQIRASETGLLTGQSEHTIDVPIPAPEPKKEEKKPKASNPKLARESIREAFKILKDQKKVTVEGFKTKFLGNRNLDDIADNELLNIKNLIKAEFTEFSGLL